jgi:hypothetical protein
VGTPRLRSEAWAVRTLVDGVRPDSPEDAGGWSAWWQCQDTESLASRELDPPTPPSAAAAADRAEFADCFPGLSEASASRDRDGDGSTGAPYDFDPVGELRSGREPALAPGALGRAAVSAAELTALRFPERAVSQLTDAARQLRAAGDELAAEQATLLAGLAAARCQDRPAAEAAWSSVQQAQPAHLTALLQLAAWAGWQQRAEAMIAYLDRRPAESGLPPSPEITLPTTDERRSLRSLVSRGEAAYGEAAAVGSGVALVAGIATVGSVDLSAAAGGALILVLVRILFVWVGEPYRLKKARKIRVSQTEAGRVAAESVPSRGVRDLRGLGLATIVGALAGRWPFWSMFFPWHGRWTQDGPADPGPGFDLDGLRLPRRNRLSRLTIIESRLSRLTMIEIAMDDGGCFPLPWEQWLNASASADQAPTLLWFRRFGGCPPALRGKRWKQAGAVYHGPKHLAPDRERPPEVRQEPALRMLHVVGTPVPTSAGWRLRVAETRAQVSTASRRKAAGEELLSMARFPLNRTALAVLQADPVDGPPEPLADQRSGFMGCARDLLDGGVGAVLVIPPLPDDVGGEVIRTAWHMAANRRRPRSPTDLLRLLAHVKRLVAASEAQVSSSERAVSDVVLFLRAPVEAGADRPVVT